MRTIKFFSRNEKSTLQQVAKPQTGRGCHEVCGGIFGGIAGLLAGMLAVTPSRDERASRALKQDWVGFRLILLNWGQSVRDSFLRRGAKPAFFSDPSPARQHLREDLGVSQTQQKRGAGLLLNHRLIMGFCGAVCLVFMSSCAHCPMCGHCGAGAPGGNSPANKGRTAQARRGALEAGSAQQHFETPIHRSPR